MKNRTGYNAINSKLPNRSRMNIKSFTEIFTKGSHNTRDIVYFLLLTGWSLFQYSRGNELYAICISLLFIILSIPRLRSFALVSAFVLVIIFYKTPILDAWIEIRDTNLLTFQSFKPSIARLFTPNSGRDTLPDDVQQMLSLIQENNITEYRLAISFEQDPLTYQRIIKSAWPVKLESKSIYVLLPTSEIANLSGCIEVDRRKDVALVSCP